MNNTCKGQITITSVSNGLTINTWLESTTSTTQVTDSTGKFAPDWSVSPHLTITPYISVAGVTGNAIAKPGAIKEGSVSWRINPSNPNTVKPNGSVQDFNNEEYGATYMGADSLYALKIRKNMQNASTTVIFKCTYIHIDGTTIDLESKVDLIKIMNPDDILAVIIEPGATGNVIGDSNEKIVLTAHAYKGAVDDCRNMEFKWFRRVQTGTQWDPITASTPNVTISDALVADHQGKGNCLTISEGFIDNYDCIKVVATNVGETGEDITEGRSASDIINVYDESDEYTLQIDTVGHGTSLQGKNDYIELKAVICKRNIPMTSTELNNKFEDIKYSWAGYKTAYYGENDINVTEFGDWERRIKDDFNSGNSSIIDGTGCPVNLVNVKYSDFETNGICKAVFECVASYTFKS